MGRNGPQRILFPSHRFFLFILHFIIILVRDYLQVLSSHLSSSSFPFLFYQFGVWLEAEILSPKRKGRGSKIGRIELRGLNCMHIFLYTALCLIAMFISNKRPPINMLQFRKLSDIPRWHFVSRDHILDERSPKKTKLNFCHIQFRYILLHQSFHFHVSHLHLVLRKEMFRSLFSCEMLLLEISLWSAANSHRGEEGQLHRKRGNLV